MPHVKQLAVLAFMDNGECHQAVLTADQHAKLKVFLFHLTEGELKAFESKLPVTLKDFQSKESKG